MSATLNGRPQRKQLSDQLDRLDQMIDTLAEALPQAVADATREGTRQALRDVLSELLRDPETLARLRQALGGPTPSNPEHPATGPVVASGPDLTARTGDTLRRGATTLGSHLRTAFATIKARVQAAKARASAAIETAQAFVPVRRFAATAATVGVAVAVVSYVAPQGVSAVVSGIGGAVVAAAVQTYRWLRRSARSVGLLA